MNERQSIRKKTRKKTNKYHKSYFIKLRKKIYEMTIRKKYGNPYIPKNGSLWYKGRNGCDFVFGLKNGLVTSIGAGWSY